MKQVVVEAAENWREDAHPRGAATTEPHGFHVECGPNVIKSSPFSREAGYLVWMWNLPILNISNQFKNLVNTVSTKQNSYELDLAGRLPACNLCSPETLPRPSVLPNTLCFHGSFILHVPLSGLPNPILSSDPNPNSYLIFKIQLRVCCVVCSAFQQQWRQRVGKPKSEKTRQVV